MSHSFPTCGIEKRQAKRVWRRVSKPNKDKMDSESLLQRYDAGQDTDRSITFRISGAVLVP